MNAREYLVDIVVPAFDEERTLGPNVELLLAYLRAEFPFSFRIVVVDNASTDSTARVGADLAAAHEEVSFLRLEHKARGLALRTAWAQSDADVVSYMDVDLSTNLESFLPLVAPLFSGHSEVAIGTRLVHQAHVRRNLEREILSRGYNALVRVAFGAGFSDAQCGFKALRSDAARLLLPLVEDDGWFFDTELLLLAERNGLRIHEVPVDWIEDLDSRVDVLPTIAGDLAGLWRMRRKLRGGHGRPTNALPAGVRQLGRFAVVGVSNTVLSYVVYAALVATTIPYALAGAAGFAAGAVNGYLFNSRWTFQSADSTGSRLRYLAVQLAGLGATTLLLWLFVGEAHVHRLAGYALTIPIVTSATFVANRSWAFTSGAPRLGGQGLGL